MALQGEEADHERGQWADEGASVSACSSLGGMGKPWLPVALQVPSCRVVQGGGDDSSVERVPESRLQSMRERDARVRLMGDGPV